MAKLNGAYLMCNHRSIKLFLADSRWRAAMRRRLGRCSCAPHVRVNLLYTSRASGTEYSHVFGWPVLSFNLRNISKVQGMYLPGVTCMRKERWNAGTTRPARLTNSPLTPRGPQTSPRNPDAAFKPLQRVCEVACTFFYIPRSFIRLFYHSVNKLNWG